MLAIRRLLIADRGAIAIRVSLATAELGVTVASGDELERGDILLSIEAMKMETGVSAERTGRIAEIAVTEGQQVDVGDLLLVYEGATQD